MKLPSRTLPSRTQWRSETHELHDAIDSNEGLGTLHPKNKTVMGDLLGSKQVTAWQEAKVAAVFMQETCWSSLPPLYGRYGTVHTAQLIDAICKLESAKTALVTDCGMQAIALAFDCLVQRDSNVICLRQVYNKSKSYLRRVCEERNATLVLVDEADIAAISDALSEDTSLLFAETYSNPLLHAQDITSLVSLVKERAPKAKLIVDSTIASPWGFREALLTSGVHCVVASGTKSLGGQDSDLCGYVATNDIPLANDIMDLMAMRGGILDWRRAQVICARLDTSQTNHKKRCDSAIKVAEFLAQHSAVEQVNHPSRPEHPMAQVIEDQYVRTASLMSFRLASSTEEETRHFCDVLAMTECIRYATSFDGLVSKINHHKSVSEYFTPEDALKKIGIQRLARLAIGLEHVEDLMTALDWALCNFREVSTEDVQAWQTKRRSEFI